MTIRKLRSDLRASTLQLTSALIGVRPAPQSAPYFLLVGSFHTASLERFFVLPVTSREFGLGSDVAASHSLVALWFGPGDDGAPTRPRHSDPVGASFLPRTDEVLNRTDTNSAVLYRLAGWGLGVPAGNRKPRCAHTRRGFRPLAQRIPRQ